MKRKLIACLLSISVLCSLFPTFALTASADEDPTGTLSVICPVCGTENCTEHTPCTTCGEYACTTDHSVVPAGDPETCTTCGQADCESQHENWCDVHKKDNCTEDHTTPEACPDCGNAECTCTPDVCPECGNGECTCETEPASLLFVETLLTAGTLGDLRNLMMAEENREAVRALTADELASVKAHAESLYTAISEPNDDDTAVYNELLETIAVLSGEEELPGNPEVLPEVENPVAKVGDTVFATIDEAIANWTHGTTLTLLADVTLSDVIMLSSTEYHILDLSTFTMTAASGKDAIQIVNNGRSSASYTLDIKADANDPGGITATGKAIVRTTGKSGVKDRPIIRFYGGVFNASYIVYHSGSNGTNCPQFEFHGGIFNGTIYTNRALNLFYGGTFNGSLQMSVDSSAYTLISGGTFKQLSNLYFSDLSNRQKFMIASHKCTNTCGHGGVQVYDREVYIDEYGYYVVSAAEAESIEAYVSKAPGTNDYLAYSKVAAEGGLNYTDIYTAIQNNPNATITVYITDQIDMTGRSFNGTLKFPDPNHLPNITFAEGTTPTWEVITDVPEGYSLVYSETVVDGVVTRSYTVVEVIDVTVNVPDGTGTYIFTLTGGNNVNLTFAVDAGEAVTIQDLPAGEYAVRADNSWNWRETVTVSKSVVQTTTTITATVTSNGKNQWFNGYADDTN